MVTDPSKHIPKLDFFQSPSMLVSLGYDQIFRLGCSHGTFRISRMSAFSSLPQYQVGGAKVYKAESPCHRSTFP